MTHLWGDLSEIPAPRHTLIRETALVIEEEMVKDSDHALDDVINSAYIDGFVEVEG